MATKSIRPVTRETTAVVRDRGLRAVMVTVVGGVIELRAKGLRSREVVSVSSLYERAVRERVMRERVENRLARRKR